MAQLYLCIKWTLFEKLHIFRPVCPMSMDNTCLAHSCRLYEATLAEPGSGSQHTGVWTNRACCIILQTGGSMYPPRSSLPRQALWCVRSERTELSGTYILA
ncbi:hypothetical protein PSHT_00351 [Puccinia striiformis]|uniref:Uncharacterized protein n=2 Tax=Puccinia striiformis TaxID=27350 RepID=A0A2S4W640_9BASI|nr:hypothetical protein PSTT_00682 [Puccinia striiformis]POW23294.1 hypothetical protein PSHT_00351 [Puccinia striiformis]